ncbi:hypothetical protein N9296_03820 [Amylibacter sp.]|nr:hypothetical protein [Amylibacter sp.]
MGFFQNYSGIVQRRMPGPSSTSPMNSMPAASRVSRINRKFASVALEKPSSVSSLLIVLTLTAERSDSVEMLHPRAARDIQI